MKLNDISDQEWALRVDLACLFRINAHLGWEDSINTHSTMRVPGSEHHFLINPFGLRLGEVKASALVKIDLDGNVIGESPHPINRAGYVIHSAIHMGRTDAKCVIHTHSLPGMAVAAAAEGLVEHNIFALGFHGCLSYHDFEGASGDHNTSERKRLAASLGPSNKAMILRNHGLLTCGKSVAQAFTKMHSLEKSCQLQIAAQAGGDLVLPSEDVCKHTAQQFRLSENTESEGDLDKLAWKALLRKLDRINPGYDA